MYKGLVGYVIGWSVCITSAVNVYMAGLGIMALSVGPFCFRARKQVSRLQ